MGYKIAGNKKEAIFIKRLNRFEAIVEVDGKEELVHVPNTGRLKELLIPETKVYLLDSNNMKRKTRYSLMFVNKNDKLICINSSLANRVLEEAIIKGDVYLGDGELKREVTYGNSKFDFYIKGEKHTFIEVKCATYELDGIARFPDAPTDRGSRHVEELINLKKLGYESKVIFIAFMDYAKYFTPYKEMDDKFYKTLLKAKENGVDIKCFRCYITLDEIGILNEIPVKLDIDNHYH
ncbi:MULTISPECIES: DNA/RNA nuclease SfsA [Caloramator]|uniref:Sugar fermentation stimulation protein homolog n=1 Tax=Caloramator proteoclasticus DSM 10124 TaxID=1121262 RepID=A0A1M4VDE1_9CLOT|nr:MULTISPECIES: DNA/RNA nuclease SfsA [Caloramator]SHE67024.1 sugar fermentation stimulation protein A [Caloramator proteoclasticus DSM 10124]